MQCVVCLHHYPTNKLTNFAISVRHFQNNNIKSMDKAYLAKKPSVCPAAVVIHCTTRHLVYFSSLQSYFNNDSACLLFSLSGNDSLICFSMYSLKLQDIWINQINDCVSKSVHTWQMGRTAVTASLVTKSLRRSMLVNHHNTCEQKLLNW